MIDGLPFLTVYLLKRGKYGLSRLPNVEKTAIMKMLL